MVPPGLETKAELLAFLARAIPLPDYFGHNWDALEECLGNLDWREIKPLVLVHRDVPLAGNPSDQRVYLQILADAAREPGLLRVVFPEKFRVQIERND